MLAPEGTIARPTAPVEAIASTSTVGRPRESSTWRAFSAFKVAMRFLLSIASSRTVAQIIPGRRLGSKRLAGERPRRRLTPGVEVLDRALAVDPRQAASRRVQDGSTDQLGPRRGVQILADPDSVLQNRRVKLERTRDGEASDRSRPRGSS